MRKRLGRNIFAVSIKYTKQRRRRKIGLKKNSFFGFRESESVDTGKKKIDVKFYAQFIYFHT